MAALRGGLSGLLFGVGLVVSGMARPGKVLAFLDFAGDWDPSLAFVMGGAVLVYAVIFRVVTARRLVTNVVLPPAAAPIDAPLLVGAAVFGVGWGLAGFCPGPSLVALGSGALGPALFGVGMLGGMWLFRIWSTPAPAPSDAPSAADAPSRSG